MLSTQLQQHYFNAPYQLSIMPEYMRSDGSLQSDPEDADIVDIQLERGDTILLATDGLYDNLFDHVRLEEASASFWFVSKVHF
jgi:protein phosphatase PTC7